MAAIFLSEYFYLLLKALVVDKTKHIDCRIASPSIKKQILTNKSQKLCYTKKWFTCYIFHKSFLSFDTQVIQVACFTLGIHLIKSDQYLSHQRVHACWLFTFVSRFCTVLSKASILVYSFWKSLSGEPAKALASSCSGEALDSVVARTRRNNNRNVCERNMAVSMSLLYIEYSKINALFF